MKYVLMALLAFGATNTYALETIKVLDGKVAHCKTKYDQYRARLGAYSFNATAVSVDDEKVQLTTEVNFLKCVADGEGFAWEDSTVLADSEYNVLDSDGSTRTITVIANKAMLRVMRDGVYQIIDEVILGEKSESVTLNLDLYKLLSDDESDRLSNGEEIRVDADVFLVKNVTFTGLASGEDLRMNKSFGTYRVRFLMKQNNDGTLSAKRL